LVSFTFLLLSFLLSSFLFLFILLSFSFAPFLFCSSFSSLLFSLVSSLFWSNTNLKTKMKTKGRYAI
jgi:hypothetical protein